jgi:hypothetical protein
MLLIITNLYLKNTIFVSKIVEQKYKIIQYQLNMGLWRLESRKQ